MLIYLLVPFTSLPALLVSVLGLGLTPERGRPERKETAALFLLAAAVVLSVPVAVFAWRVQEGMVAWPLILTMPTLVGVLAVLIQSAGRLRDLWEGRPWLVSSLLLALIAVCLGVARVDLNASILLFVAPVIGAVVWLAADRIGWRWQVYASLALTALMVLETTGLAAHPAIFRNPAWMTAYRVAGPVAVILTMLAMALLLDRGLEALSLGARDRAWISLGAVALLSLGFAAITFRDGLMVNATGHGAEDNMPFISSGLAVIFGLLLFFGNGKHRSLSGALYLVLLPLLLTLSFAAAWIVDTEAVTAARAARLDRAINRYHEETGAYPSSLGELTPGTLPLILGPMTGRGQAWCYQGGEEYYRLGYAYYQRYSREADGRPFSTVRIHSAAGPVPDGPWECDRALEAIEATRGL